MNEDFSTLSEEAKSNAYYAFCRRARPKDWQVLKARSGENFDYQKAKQSEILEIMAPAAGNAEFFYEKPNDDRMDYHHFRKDDSREWFDFSNTYAGKHIQNLDRFRANVDKTVNAVAAVVRRCQFDKFPENTRSLDQVIFDKFDGRKFNGNFGEQMCLSRGTAFLIGKNLLLTAAHNLYDGEGKIPDNELVYVFGYHYDELGNPPQRDSVSAYKGNVLGIGKETNDDWAIVHLQEPISEGNGKPLSEREPLELSSDIRHPKKRLGCYSAGFSLGVPMKLSLVGHYMHKLLEDRFSVNLDMFHGNSGSPVLNIRTNKVIGLFVAGYPDLVEQPHNTIGLRYYRYGDIAHNRGGEHCQLIGKIYEPILKILQPHGLNEDLFRTQNTIGNE